MVVIGGVSKLKVWCAEESSSEVLDEFSGIFIKSLLHMKSIIMRDEEGLMMVMNEE